MDDPAAASIPRLVLLVGLGPLIDAALHDALGRAGIRSLRLPASAEASIVAGQARVDAVVLRLPGPVAAAARRLDAWRCAFEVPLLVLCEGGDEVDEIVALELGADAALPQAASARRLRAQLLSMLRRRSVAACDEAGPAAPGPAGWWLDRPGRRLVCGSRRLALTGLQVDLLDALLSDSGQVLDRARLAEAVSRGRPPGPRSVDVYVARLRRRLQEAQVEAWRIEGVRGLGYRLDAVLPAAAVAPAEPQPELEPPAMALTRAAALAAP